MIGLDDQGNQDDQPRRKCPHAGMAGRTNMVVGFWMNTLTHVPIPLEVSRRKKVDPEGWVWSSVLTSTGQPKEIR